MTEEKRKADVFDPRRWGLPCEAVADLGDRLRGVWSGFRDCFRTRTRDTSEHAFVYLRGLLTLPEQRNYANIARRVNGLEDDGQDLQHFMSDSPWNQQAVFDRIQGEIKACPPLRDGMMTLDESGDKRAGEQAAGTARQYIGRIGKAARQVWTITPKGQVRQEWLFIRREPDTTFSFSLSNAPAHTPLSQLALWRSQRYFAERTIQDAKSEAGWDELVARKYRAWVHHIALDALALWFVAETKLDWAKAYPRDPDLLHQLEVEVLPALSVANVREMLQAVLPLKQLSQEQAIALVVKHLVNRSLSTRSRLKAQRRNRGPT